MHAVRYLSCHAEHKLFCYDKGMKKPSSPHASILQKLLPYVLTIGGAIGFVAAFVITVEKIELIKNPAFIPSCNISPLISCGSVMASWQASVFGFPNPLIGIASFALVVTIGMALFAGATFKRWFWLGLQAGTIFGILFVTWLQYQAIFVIQALCPYCMVVWTIMIPIFVYTTLYNLEVGHIKTPSSLARPVAFLERNHYNIVLVWYMLIIAIILQHFWSYWSTLI